MYGFLFDVEEQYQQEMETYLAQDTDVAYTSILTMKATVSSVKNVVLLIGGMIGAVFALVGLINFINLVMTNIIKLLLQTLFDSLAALVLFVIFELETSRPMACNNTRKTVHMVLLSRHPSSSIILAIDEINQP